MKVAFVSTVLEYPWGGADALWTRAAEAASHRGDDLLIAVSALTAAHSRVTALRARGAEIIVRPQPPRPARLHRRVWRRIYRGAVGDALVRRLNKFQPDVVIVSCGGTYDLLLEAKLVSWLTTTKTRLRVIANFQVEHPTLPASDRETIAEVLNSADRVFFVSTRNLAATRRHLLGSLPHATVLHNPLRCDAGAALPVCTPPPFRLATVSRLEHGKGIAMAIHAVSAALRNEPDWQVDIFGTGPEATHLSTTIAALGLSERIHLRGFEESLARIWRDHHLLISPSLEDGVPMTIPEAMLHGRPVLATSVGGAADWISHGRNGFLCPAPTVGLLTDGLLSAWQLRHTWSTLGRQAALDAAATYRPQDFEQVITP